MSPVVPVVALFHKTCGPSTCVGVWPGETSTFTTSMKKTRPLAETAALSAKWQLVI